MLALATPASLADCLAVLAPDGVCVRLVWACTRLQIARGLSYAVRDEAGRTLAIGGYWPTPDYWEAWGQLSPHARARMREVLRLARLTLRDLGDDPRPVVAVARTPAGARMASLIGFRHQNGVYI